MIRAAAEPSAARRCVAWCALEGCRCFPAALPGLHDRKNLAFTGDPGDHNHPLPLCHRISKNEGARAVRCAMECKSP